MTPKEINELIGQKVMGWTLRRSKNPRYDWYVNAEGNHAGLVRNFNPAGPYGDRIADCFRAFDRLIKMGYRNFQLIHVCCVDGFAWDAEIMGPWGNYLADKTHYGGAGATREEAICSMIVKILEAP